jgi:SAM-dependent methyltransferase
MTAVPCLVCGATKWQSLPNPASRSMASDWRIVDEPLARELCRACGLIRRTPTANTGTSFYESGYTLYAHPPGGAREQSRQGEYARWIAQATGRRPRRVLDVGCGNGSLLRALRTYWPDADLLGCDPSRDSIAQGYGSDLRLWTGTASNLPGDLKVDLVIAVNVIEHTTDPPAFLNALRAVLEPDGLIVIVCPDGAKPGIDLLFVDHVFSFGSEHVGTLLARAGMGRLGATQAPRSLGAFQMAIGRRRDAVQMKALHAPPRTEDVTRYLERWRQLDERLLERIEGPLVCFGAAETAGLLRAYAPRAWASVRACTIDGEPQGRFGELPIIALSAVAADADVLLGVRPSDQPRLAERLSARVRRVVTWYDLVDEQPHA